MFLPAPISAAEEALLYMPASSNTLDVTAGSSRAPVRPLPRQDTARLTSNVNRSALAYGRRQAAAAAANQASPAEARAAFVAVAAPHALPLQEDVDTARANANPGPQLQATAAVSGSICGMLFDAFCWSAKAAYTSFVPASVQACLDKFVKDVQATSEEIYILNNKGLQAPEAVPAVAEDGADHQTPLANTLQLAVPMPYAKCAPDPSIAEVLQQMRLMQSQFDAGMVEAAQEFAGIRKLGGGLQTQVVHLLARSDNQEAELRQIQVEVEEIKIHQVEQDMVADGLAEREDKDAPAWDQDSARGNYDDEAFFFGMGDPSVPEDSSVVGAGEDYDDLPALELCSDCDDNEADRAGEESEGEPIDFDALD